MSKLTERMAKYAAEHPEEAARVEAKLTPIRNHLAELSARIDALSAGLATPPDENAAPEER